MGADEVFGRARVDAQEVAVVPLALHLLPIVLAGGQFEHHFRNEGRDGLQAVVPGDILVGRTSIGLDSVPLQRKYSGGANQKHLINLR